MMRVVAMFIASRSIVAISRIVGNEENSSGRWIQSETIRIRTDRAIEKASPMSMRIGGSGRNRIARMATIPSAKPTSRPCFLGNAGERAWICAIVTAVRFGPVARTRHASVLETACQRPSE
jgi:hypothetical protein